MKGLPERLEKWVARDFSDQGFERMISGFSVGSYTLSTDLSLHGALLQYSYRVSAGHGEIKGVAGQQKAACWVHRVGKWLDITISPLSVKCKGHQSVPSKYHTACPDTLKKHLGNSVLVRRFFSRLTAVVIAWHVFHNKNANIQSMSPSLRIHILI